MPKPESLPIAHPLLRKWVDGTAVATKMTANLTPDEMHNDVWISWASFSEKGTTRFSHQGAWFYALNWGIGSITACLLAAFFLGPRGANSKKRVFRSVGLGIGFGIILTLAIYTLLPKTQVRLVRDFHPFFGNYSFLSEFGSLATSQEGLADARDMLRCCDPENYLVGGKIREEDSPGNYQLRQGSNRVECVIYDASGAPSSD
jgi:hypothetical protein